MIEVFREADSPEADWIEADLKDLAAGYDRYILTLLQAQGILGKSIQLPVVRDGSRIASGREDILAFLKDFHKLVENWRKFQVDACYVDDDGETC